MYYTKLNKKEKFQVDVLLHLNTALTSELGTDSTNDERKFIKALRRDNLRKIKEISPAFYKEIDDGER